MLIKLTKHRAVFLQLNIVIISFTLVYTNKKKRLEAQRHLS